MQRYAYRSRKAPQMSNRGIVAMLHSYIITSERRGGDGAARPVPGVWGVNIPLRTALFRFSRVIRFFMRKGLKVNGLGTKGSKNGPPTSASVRVFPEELFFEGGGKDAAITGRRDARRYAPSRRRSDARRRYRTAFYRVGPPAVFLGRIYGTNRTDGTDGLAPLSFAST